MTKAYRVFQDSEDDSFTLCKDIESDGGLTLLHGTVAKHIPDEETARLLAHAPVLLEACSRALTALNTAPRFRVPALDTDKEKTDSYQIASLLSKALRQVKEDGQNQ